MNMISKWSWEVHIGTVVAFFFWITFWQEQAKTKQEMQVGQQKSDRKRPKMDIYVYIYIYIYIYIYYESQPVG